MIRCYCFIEHHQVIYTGLDSCICELLLKLHLSSYLPLPLFNPFQRGFNYMKIICTYCSCLHQFARSHHSSISMSFGATVERGLLTLGGPIMSPVKHFFSLFYIFYSWILNALFLFKANQSNRVCNALALLQCVASHPETRSPFLQGMLLHMQVYTCLKIPNFLFHTLLYLSEFDDVVSCLYKVLVFAV